MNRRFHLVLGAVLRGAIYGLVLGVSCHGLVGVLDARSPEAAGSQTIGTS